MPNPRNHTSNSGIRSEGDEADSENPQSSLVKRWYTGRVGEARRKRQRQEQAGGGEQAAAAPAPRSSRSELLGQVEDTKRGGLARLRALRELRAQLDQAEAEVLWSIRSGTRLSWRQVGEVAGVTRAAAQHRAFLLWDRYGWGRPESVEYGTVHSPWTGEDV